MTENNNKTNNRTPRSADTRAEKVARKPWSPPSTLETPPAPDGYTYRWIRAENVGVEDRKNITARLSEGFELVRSDQLSQEDQNKYDSMQQGQHAGVVARGGLLLAKIPNETREERNSYFAQRAQTQQQAIDNDLMRESDPNSPILSPERKSKVTFGGGQRS